MKKLDNIVWDLNTRATEAKILDGKTEKELGDAEKSSRIFSEKEQEEIMKTHGNFVLVNPRAGTKTVTDTETGKEVQVNLVGSSHVSPRVGVVGLLVAISKMSPSTGGDKFALKEKSKFAGIELVKGTGDKTTPPIYIVKLK